MPRFQVWSNEQHEETEAVPIHAADPETAAVIYAEGDIDGHINGVYDHDIPHIIHVRRDDGMLKHFEVHTEITLSYVANAVEPAADEGDT